MKKVKKRRRNYGEEAKVELILMLDVVGLYASDPTVYLHTLFCNHVDKMKLT